MNKRSFKYKFQEIEISPGDRGIVTWFTDEEVEAEFRRSEGQLISLEEASLMFYRNALDGNGVVIPIYKLGILGYAHSLGFRVDLLSALNILKAS